MIDYSTEQKEFLISIGKVVLHACPGSGKTTVVARKMIDYLQHWDRPHQGIAALSFTNVASDEIKQQSIELLPEGVSIDTPHFVGTLDSFINHYIFLRFGYLFNEASHRPKIVTKQIVNSYPFWGRECRGKCLSKIEEFEWNADGSLTKNGQMIQCKGKGNHDPQCIQFKKKMISKGQFFQAEVAGLSGILLEMYPEIAKCIASRFPVIILDEAQDSSREQMHIIDLLCKAGLESIFIVGDPDQAIYEWRNADAKCFLEKMNDPEWIHLSLTENRRSSQLICNATHVFSDTYKNKIANKAIGLWADYSKKPILFLYDKNITEGVIIHKYIEECSKSQISLSPDSVAVVTRASVKGENEINNLWKTETTEYLALASFEWTAGNRTKAYLYCEKALFQLSIKDINDIDVSIEYEVSKKMPYSIWRQFVVSILMNLPSANESCCDWLKLCRETIKDALKDDRSVLLKDVKVEEEIKIKTRDKNVKDFDKRPVKTFFKAVTPKEYLYSSIHGVKGKTFDALMLYVPPVRGGNTLTSKFLATGNTDNELMRIAYVAMTRPRKLLVIAMPNRKEDLSIRFPKDVWEYIEL